MGFGLTLVLFSHASWSLEPAMTFIEPLLAHDFQGDGVYRIGKVIFTSSLPPERSACDCSGPAREAFSVDGDPLVLVSTWVIERVRESGRYANVVVKFRVLATSVGEGEEPSGKYSRKLIAAHPPKDQHVAYRLKVQGDHWFLVDPPLPRVGISPAIDAMSTVLSSWPSIEECGPIRQRAYE